MIILASQSPRRQEILTDILGDIPYKTIPSSFNERAIQVKDIRKLCKLEAQGKGKDISDKYPLDYVISADTMVYFKGEQLGKPKDREDAKRMLRMLSGATHEVVTAYSIFKGGEELISRTVIAKLYIEKMADSEIEMYLDTLSPFDKAGAYGIQDSDFIDCKILSGDYFTIMGLPRNELEKDLLHLQLIK